MAGGHGSKRGTREDVALAALLTESSIARAATVAGVSEGTLLRWLADPSFKARHHEARRAVLDQAVSQLQRAASAAVATLAAIAEDVDAPSAARVSAAKTILDQAFRGLEVLDLAHEVESLKERLSRDREGGSA